MTAHPWDHNRHYHRWVLRRVPRCARALDVGCGRGELARALAGRAGSVDAVDTDPDAVRAAAQATPDGSVISFRTRSLLDVGGPYEVITAVAVLHHLDLASAVRALRSALAPGGRLLIVGCYREVTAVDHAITALAVPLNMAIGLVTNARSARRSSRELVAPQTRPATTAFDDVRTVVRSELPGARLRRALFWRYVLDYTEPR